MSDQTANLPTTTRPIVRSDDGPLGFEDREALERAVRALEHSSVAMRVANTLGRQLGTLTRLLPMGVSSVVNAAAERAIRTALSVAMKSLGDSPPRDTRRLHKFASALSGAAGGAFGIVSLPVELPISTVIILRSIAEIARQEGEDISDPQVAMACLEVFALGAHDRDDDYTDSGYYAVRGLLARTVSEAGRFVLTQGIGDETAPVLVRFVAKVASRFGIVVSEKLAAQAVPLVGAAGGAAVNYAFAEHFQSLAFGHFTVRRLERRYGGDVVRAEYHKLLEIERDAA